MAISTSRLEALPEELLLHIMSFLEPREITILQSVSKDFLRVCRDGSFWRIQCLSAYASKRLARLAKLGLLTPPSEEDGRSLSADQEMDGAQPVDWNLIGNTSILRSKHQREHVRMVANWDPTFPHEPTNWYDEYIHRHGSTAVNFFQRPSSGNQAHGTYHDVKGCVLYPSTASTRDLMAVSPLDDGSVCLWDVRGTRGKRGAILTRSKPGLLHGQNNLAPKGVDPVECVSIDSQRNRAFFAIERRLVEIDLETLAVVGQWPFEWSIHTLSTVQPSIPLTVGTTVGLHLFDHRSPSGTPPLYAPLAQPGPIKVLHMEQPGNLATMSDDIFVAGRFSNILHYDRRVFPTIKGSIHSGASLCGLASLPYPFSCVSSELRRSFQLSEDDIVKDKRKSGRTLVACGEYNTKGSLEMYGLGESEPSQHTFRTSTLKNRQTASSSKLLSVINHGTRLVFSDGTGCLKWMERDGFTEVRRLKLGKSERFVQDSIFRTMPGSDEMALKLLSTNVAQAGPGEESARNNEDDILFWTGDKLGLITFSARPGSYADEFEASTKTPEEQELEEEQHLYNERMRQALEQQAIDAHFVQQLGAW